MYDNRSISKLFWPVFVEQGFVTLVSLLYTVMIAGIGPAAVSGVGLVTSINLLLMNLFTSMSLGVTVSVSHRLGGDDIEGAGKIAGQAVVAMAYFSIAIAVIFAVFSRPIVGFLFAGADGDVLEAADTFLLFTAVSMPLQAVFSCCAGIMRSTGNNRTPMFASILANVVYLIVAAITIFGLNMGVAGSGVGLLVSRIFSSGFLIWVLARGQVTLRIPKLRILPDISVLKPALKIAVPAGVDSLLFNGSKIIVQMIMAGMGTAAISAYTIAFTIYNFLTLPMTSMQLVSTTVVARTFGAGRLKEVRSHMIKLTGVTMVMQAVMSLIMLPLTGLLVGMFNPLPEALELTRILLYISYIAAPILLSASFVLPNMLRATGSAKYTMWVSIVSVVLLRVGLSYLFGVVLGWGVVGIWLAMVADWIGRGIPFITAALRCRWAGRALPVREEELP